VRVRTARPDVLGKLGMPHRKHLKNELPVEVVIQPRKLFLNIRQTVFEGCAGFRLAWGDQSQKVFKFGYLALQMILFVIGGCVFSHAVQPRKSRSKDNAGFIRQRLGKHPAIGQHGTLAGFLVVHHQWDARIAQRVNPRRDRHLRADVCGFSPFRRYAKLLDQVKASTPPSQLDHLLWGIDGFDHSPGIAFHQSYRPLIHHHLPRAVGDGFDEDFSVQDALNIVFRENGFASPRKPQPGSANHHRSGQRQPPIASLGFSRPAGRKLDRFWP